MATELVKHQKCEKGKSKIAKQKGTNNFKLKVKKGKFFKALKHITPQNLAHFGKRGSLETYVQFFNKFQENINKLNG